jgi:hypothetical protein
MQSAVLSNLRKYWNNTGLIVFDSSRMRTLLST